MTVDNNGKRQKHKPCKRRKRETRDGVTMDWCYAIGVEEIGDMPCEYCVDRRKDRKGKNEQESYGA